MKSDFCACESPQYKQDDEPPVISNRSSIGFYEGWCKKCKKLVEPEKSKKRFDIQNERLRLPNDVAQMIPESEKVIFSCEASWKSKPRDKTGIVVLTDKNIHLIGSPPKMFGKPDPKTKEVLSLGMITGLDQTYENYLTIKSYHVKITRANNEDTLYNLSHETAIAFIDSTNGVISKGSNSSPSNAIDSVEQLTKLAALLEKGLITQEEFNKKKQELL